jgi:hypothetical protein
MPIRGLEFYQKPQTAKLSELSGCRIGIDAAHFLRKLMAKSRENSLNAIAGYPLTLQGLIKTELDNLK